MPHAKPASFPGGSPNQNFEECLRVAGDSLGDAGDGQR